MDFTKIKHGKDGVVLKWTTPAEGGRVGETVHHELTSANEPAKPFIEALAALRTNVGDVLEVEEDWTEGLRVVGVSINYEEDGRRGFVVTALKDLDATNAPAVINTPHQREYVEGDPDGKYAESSLVSRINRLERAAEAYVNGERGQLDMFGSEEPAEAEPAGAGA
jgi:hypothetical protein